MCQPEKHFQQLPLWHHKTKVPGLSCSIVCVILRLAVEVKPRLVMDGHAMTVITCKHSVMQ